MEPTLALQAPVMREDPSSYATDDPLDLQGLWPITTDFVNAACHVSASLCAIARSLSQDDDDAASTLRQTLLEIRARLVYLFTDISARVVANTSQLINYTANVIAAHLQNDPRTDSPADLAYIVTLVLDTCSSSNRLLLETLTACDSFFVSLQHYQPRVRLHPGSVASILHSIGTFVSPIVSPNASPAPSPQQISMADSVRRDLARMNTSIDQIEAFWRKRQNLYVGSSYTFGHEQMVRFHRSCGQLGTSYLHFVNPLRDSRYDLCRARPSIDASPDTLNEETRSQLAWRALLS